MKEWEEEEVDNNDKKSQSSQGTPKKNATVSQLPAPIASSAIKNADEGRNENGKQSQNKPTLCESNSQKQKSLEQETTQNMKQPAELKAGDGSSKDKEDRSNGEGLLGREWDDAEEEKKNQTIQKPEAKDEQQNEQSSEPKKGSNEKH